MQRREFIKMAASAMTQARFAVVGSEQAFAAPSSRSTDRLFLGVDYYPDQTPQHLWGEDARMMAEAGISTVRIAEFAWALMEPVEGTYDFGWLTRSITILKEHKIDVILGTPSAAPPSWLTKHYPQVLLVADQGVTMSPGSRRMTCPTNRTYRDLVQKIVTRMADTFHAQDGVVAWQIDNELTLSTHGRCYCVYCKAGFQQWLKERYGSIGKLNEAWGTVVWSEIFSTFDDIPVPLPTAADHNPSLLLEYDRYQSFANVSFLNEQVSILRARCPGHAITTNNLAAFADTLNLTDLYESLDFAAADNYPGFFEVLAAGPDSGASIPDAYLASTFALSLDVMRGAKDGKPFLLMEEQTGQAGTSILTAQPEPGQVRLWAYQGIAHGAMGVHFFRWDTPAFGAEQYWKGMLDHDRSKAPAFGEIQQTLAEFRQLGQRALQARLNSDCALCFDSASDWAAAIQPGHAKLKYFGEVGAWYTALWGAQYGVDVVDCRKPLNQYRIVLAPYLYVVDAQQAAVIEAYVQAGGIFVTGYRSGEKNEYGRLNERGPGPLTKVLGVSVEGAVPMYDAKQSIHFESGTGGDAECQFWYEVLTPKEATVVARYMQGREKGKPAITSNHVGKGRAIYLGARLDPAGLAKFLGGLVSEADVRSNGKGPNGVEISVRREGVDRWKYILNHNPDSATIDVGGKHVSLLDGKQISGSLEVPAFGVAVLKHL